MMKLLGRFLVGFLTLLLTCDLSLAWSGNSKISHTSRTQTTCVDKSQEHNQFLSRRNFIKIPFLTVPACAISLHTPPAFAYTPDPDKLRESLYFISRVQEATVQQERFVSRTAMQEDLKNKMKLTLRLVEKNYRLLDQINYASSFVEPKEELVTASEAGYEAAEALQNAIDFVRNDLTVGPLTDAQKKFITSSLTDCRENLFVFLKYMPQEKLEAARRRVEEENVLNRDEFDGDKDAGVYNPVVLPWKQR